MQNLSQSASDPSNQKPTSLSSPLTLTIAKLPPPSPSLSLATVLKFFHSIPNVNGSAAHPAAKAKMYVFRSEIAYASRSASWTSGEFARAPRFDAPALITSAAETALVRRGICWRRLLRRRTWPTGMASTLEGGLGGLVRGKS